MKSFLFLLSIIGCCVGQDLLPDGPVEAFFGKNVTFQTLVDLKDDYITFVWFYNSGSRPVPIVTVTPAGETVAEGYQGRVRVNRTNGFLTLGPLKANDRGFYNATIVTSQMMKTGETMLRVLGCCDWYALPEGPVDAVSGKPVTFKTLISPKENFNGIVWFFGNQRLATVTSSPRASVVSEAYKERVKLNQTNGFLTLMSPTTGDSGDYFINIFTAKGVKTGETKLRVLEPVSNVTIRANVPETVEFNSTVVLTCSAKGSFLKFSWTSGKATIMADNTRLTIKEEATSSMLTISGIQSSDLAGPIYCTAANQLEMEKSAPFNLAVIFPAPPSVVTHPARPRVVSAVWSVTFENPDPCALKGSSVHFRCSYDHPDGETVHKNTWLKGEVKDGSWKRAQLSSLPSYQNRVKYLGDQEHNCSLAIYDLQDDDTGYYYFRFDTYTYGWHSKRSVYLSVTDLTANVKPDSVSEGQNVTLTCDTSCKLPRPSTIVWFRNGQPVDKPPHFQASAEDAGSYTCAVKGQESVQSNPVFLDVQYAPVNVLIEVSHNGTLAEGSSVNLTCSSAAKPVGRYTWYRRTSSSSLLQVGSGKVLSLASLDLSNAGLYVCQVRNRLGEKSSTEVRLEVDVSERPTEEGEEGGDLKATSSHAATSSHTTMSPYTTLSSPPATSSHTTMSPYTTLSSPPATSSHTTMSPYTTLSSHAATSSHTTMSPYTTLSSPPATSSHETTTLDGDTRLDQHTWFGKLQAELLEMRLSFERSLRQMESRTHSLLWSMSRRLERMTEAVDRNFPSSHQDKTYLSLSRLLSRGVSAVTPSSQPTGSRPMNLHTRGQRRREGRRGTRS